VEGTWGFAGGVIGRGGNVDEHIISSAVLGQSGAFNPDVPVADIVAPDIHPGGSS
jgi:hypothetical protein